MIIFDIGANLGKYTETVLQKYPGSKVVACEPNDDLASYLAKRFKDQNVIVCDLLVSDQDGEQKPFFISDYENTISTASTEWILDSRFSKSSVWNRKTIKTTITIDALIQKYGPPDLIKIDVEGYELQVLNGLSSKQKYVCFEWAEEQKLNIIKCFERLSALGYEKFSFTENDDYDTVPDQWFDKEKCIEMMDMNIARKVRWGMAWAK